MRKFKKAQSWRIIKGWSEETWKDLWWKLKTIKGLRMGKSEKSCGRSKKSWDMYSRQHQSVIKTSLANDIENATCFITNQHFQPISVEIINRDTGKKECLDLDKATYSSCSDVMDIDHSSIHYLWKKKFHCLMKLTTNSQWFTVIYQDCIKWKLLVKC